MSKNKSSIASDKKNLFNEFFKKYTKQLIIACVVFGVFFIINYLIGARIINKYISGLIILSCINIILAIGLNLITGITGQLSLGNAAFMAIGAYVSAFFSAKLGMPFIVAIIAGALTAAAVAIMVGIPTLKLKGDYFAIATLGVCEIIRVLITNIELVGGARGFSGIPKKTTFTIAYFAVVAVIIIVVNIVKSTKGRAMLAIRDNEIAAEAMGINTTKYKVTAFIIAAMISGVAGGLFSHYTAFIQPTSFNFLKSIEIVTFVVLGGMGSITGSIIAAIVLTILPEALRSFSDLRMIFYAGTLVLLMIFRPQGLMGTLEITDIIDIIKKKIKGKANKNITEVTENTVVKEG